MKTNLMNQMFRRAMQAGVCAGLALCLSRAEDKPAEAKPKADVRKSAESGAKKAPFLGLALGPVDESLASQINLPEGVGVLVRAVMPDSPAGKAGVKQHDVLHYFNDQLLVNEAQLQTLVRQAGIGTEVTFKLLRKGSAQTIAVKLGEQEEREPADTIRWRAREPGEKFPGLHDYFLPPGDRRMSTIPLNGEGFADQVRELTERMKDLEGKPEEMRREIERFQKEIQEQAKKAAGAAKKKAEEATRAHGGAVGTTKDGEGTIHVQVMTNDDKAGGEGSAVATATADGKGNVIVTQTNTTRTAWADGEGSGELLVENGKKRLKVKDRDGKEIFSGPVDTDEQRKSLPASVRERLERIESNVKVEVRPAGKRDGI